MRSGDHDWTGDQLDDVRAMRLKKISAASIAFAINEVYGIGISRSAVISQFRRINNPDCNKKKKEAALVRTPLPFVQSELISDGSVTLLTVHNGQCRWPLWGDEKTETFPVCGKRTRIMTRYCDHHNDISGRK